MVLAVELAQAREGHVVDVEVEAHADGVGGDEIVDLARLVERDLGIARARRQRAEHHRGSAQLAADQLGDGIDLGRRERDDGRALRQPGDLLLSGIGDLRQARARDEVGAGHEVGNRLPHGARAEQQRLLLAARMQQAVGEDVAALGVGGKLDLVDGEEFDVAGLARHRLDGGHPITGVLRLDLLLARDEGNLILASPNDDLVVDLARQQPQRQADHAGLVAEHALDGEMRLAGVGGTENGGDITDAGLERHPLSLERRSRDPSWPRLANPRTDHMARDR